MPPKRFIEKVDVIREAYQIGVSEGVSMISARKVANELGTSVAPIYSHFKSIEELQDEVVYLISQDAEKTIEAIKNESYFQKIGLASIEFAKNYPRLILDMIYHGELYDKFHQINDPKMISQMSQTIEFQGWPTKKLEDLLLRVTIFQMGLILYQAQHPEAEDLNELLLEVGSDFYQLAKDKGANHEDI